MTVCRSTDLYIVLLARLQRFFLLGMGAIAAVAGRLARGKSMGTFHRFAISEIGLAVTGLMCFGEEFVGGELFMFTLGAALTWCGVPGWAVGQSVDPGGVFISVKCSLSVTVDAVGDCLPIMPQSVCF
jgi:hypothetical protein